MAKTTQEKIQVMQDFEAGKGKLQNKYRDNSNDPWEDVTAKEPVWNWSTLDYRVVRKPKTFWVAEFRSLTDGAFLGEMQYDTKEECENKYKGNTYTLFIRAVKFVEQAE